MTVERVQAPGETCISLVVPERTPQLPTKREYLSRRGNT
jgi:hypothetical protein